jgi:hypothetical protein
MLLPITKLYQYILGARGSSSSGSAGATSNLAYTLVNKRAQGDMSAATIQEIAQAADEDNFPCHRIARLANLGTRGKHKNNCNYQLHLTFGLHDGCSFNNGPTHHMP